MGSVLQISINHKYKCCIPEIIDDVETNDESENSKQIVNQIHVIEKTESFVTTIPVRNS